LRVWTDCGDCQRRAAYNLDITKLPHRSRFRRDVKAMGDDNSGDENSIVHNDVHFSIDNDFEDMNEERIEGLEQMIESFQKTLKRMRREIRKLKESNDELSRSINATHNEDKGTKAIKHHYQCVDKKGINRLNNEIWMEDDCTNCLCQHHQITCTTEKCPEATTKCPEGFVYGKKNGQCCPSCVSEKLKPTLNDETTITSNVTSSR
jgi:peroxidase